MTRAALHAAIIPTILAGCLLPSTPSASDQALPPVFGDRGARLALIDARADNKPSGSKA